MHIVAGVSAERLAKFRTPCASTPPPPQPHAMSSSPKFLYPDTMLGSAKVLPQMHVCTYIHTLDNPPNVKVGLG